MIDRRALLKQSGAVMAVLAQPHLRSAQRPRRDGHAAVRQRRAAAGEVSAEAADDRADQPAAAARDAVLGLQRRRHHAERRVLRALPSRRHPARRSIPTPSGWRSRARSTSRSSCRWPSSRRMPAVEIVAVNQCSGNSRGFFEPRVAGGQLGQRRDGQCALEGVPLQGGARQGGRAGRRQAGRRSTASTAAVLDKTPDFVKALDIDHARDGEVMLAYAMNGEDLPLLNGFPLRLDRAGLLRHLLGEAPQRDHRHRQRVRRLLDEDAPIASPTTTAPASSPARRPRRRCRSTASTSARSSPASPTAPR